MALLCNIDRLQGLTNKSKTLETVNWMGVEGSEVYRLSQWEGHYYS